MSMSDISIEEAVDTIISLLREKNIFPA